MQSQDILTFWFDTLSPQNWWQKDDALDNQIKNQFEDIHQRARQCELYPWRQTAKGALAEIIILDQFSRNIYRNKPESFAQDALALALAQSAIDKGFDNELSPQEKSFLYMPYMHSESRDIHKIAVKLFDMEELKHNLEFEIKHKVIIDRFGRYPHRNNILGRVSTQEEIAFLTEPNSSF